MTSEFVRFESEMGYGAEREGEWCRKGERGGEM